MSPIQIVCVYLHDGIENIGAGQKDRMTFSEEELILFVSGNPDLPKCKRMKLVELIRFSDNPVAQWIEQFRDKCRDPLNVGFGVCSEGTAQRENGNDNQKKK